MLIHYPFNPCTKLSESLFKEKVSPVDLTDIVNYALSLRTEACDEQRHACPYIGAYELGSVEF